MMRNILALTRYGRLGASSRVRVLQYLPALEAAGFAVDVQPLFSESDLLRLYNDGTRSKRRMLTALKGRLSAMRGARSDDIVWLQQELFPFLPFGIEAALLGGRKLVIDFDDAHHLYYKDRRLARPWCGDKIERLMRRADAVVVGNPTMAGVARNAGAGNVHMVYSAVDTQSFPAAPSLPARFTVGWIGTPMTARQSLPIIAEPLKRFLSETDSAAIFVGMDENQFPELRGRRLPWSEEIEREVLPRLSVGLCPLDDTPWTRGKSGYKIMQYMAAAKPTLASPVGIAADIVDDGTTGFHCRSADDWYRQLHQLYRDAALLQSLGVAGRQRAETRYDTAIAGAHLVTIFESCARG